MSILWICFPLVLPIYTFCLACHDLLSLCLFPYHSISSTPSLYNPLCPALLPTSLYFTSFLTEPTLPSQPAQPEARPYSFLLRGRS